MRFEEIMSLIDHHDMQTARMMSSANAEREYGWVVALANIATTQIDSTDTVYFAQASLFNTIPTETLGEMLFILYLDEPLAPIAANATVLTCRSFAEYRSAYETLSREFHELSKLRQQIIELTTAVSRGIGLNRIANLVAAYFGAEMSVLDGSMNVLAYSSRFPDTLDPKELFDVANSLRIPPAGMKKLEEEHLVNKSKVDNEPTIFQYTSIAGIECTNHFTFISIGEIPIGSFSLIKEGGPLRQSRIDLLPIIAHILSAELQKSSSVMLNKSAGYSRLLTRLIHNSIESLEFESTLRRLGYVLRPFKRVLYVDITLSTQQNTRIRSLAEQIRHAVSNSIYAAQENYIMFLVTYDNLPPEHDGQLDVLHGIAKSHGVRIGIGSPYRDALQTPLFLEEARRAIALGEASDPDSLIYYYSDYQILDLFNQIERPETLEFYCYPPLMRLLYEDAENGTSLTQTVLAFVNSACGAEKAASDLFIHKNTLYYRLDKAREIMGVNLKEADVIMMIKLTEHILRYREDQTFLDVMTRSGQ